MALVIGKGNQRTGGDKSQQGKTRKALKTQGKPVTATASGCSEVWYRAWFGTKPKSQQLQRFWRSVLVMR